jgi:hypothetical protein
LPDVQEASMRDRAIAGQRIMEPGVPQRPSSTHNSAVTHCECGSGLVCMAEKQLAEYVLSANAEVAGSKRLRMA